MVAMIGVMTRHEQGASRVQSTEFADAGVGERVEALADVVTHNDDPCTEAGMPTGVPFCSACHSRRTR